MSAGTSALGKKPRLLRVVSRCSSVDDFVTVFRRFSDGESLFIVTKNPKPVGTRQPVSITLSDGVPVLSGIGEVIETHLTDGGPAGRPGMRMKFASLDEEGRTVLKRLGDSGKKPLPSPPIPKLSKSPRATIAVAAAPPPPKLPGMIQSKPLPPLKKPEPKVETKPVETKPFARDLGDADETNVDENPAARELDDDETTHVSDEHAMMQRATGSKLIIPANPLSELDDDALVGFIECALYEESGMIEMPDHLYDGDEELTTERAPSSDGRDTGLPAWWPKAAAPPAGAPTNGQSASGTVEGTPPPEFAPVPPTVNDELSDGIPQAIGTVEDAATTPIPPPVLPKPSGAPIMPHLDQRPPPPRAETPPIVHELAHQPPTITPQQAAAYDNLQAGMDPYDTGVVEAQFQNRGKLIAVAVVGALLSFGIGFAIWGGDDGDEKSTEPTANEAVATNPPEKQPEPEAQPEKRPEPEAETPEPEAETPEPEAEPPEPEPEPEPEAEAETPEPEPEPEPAVAVDGDGCTLEVTSRPNKLPVIVGGRRIGTTPLTKTMGCGTVAVSLDHPRYKPFTEQVTLAPGTPGTLNARLQRPMHQMTISSSPAGATVKIGARTVGKTPVTTHVMGYEKAKIRISKPGYKTWSKRVYARYKKQRVFGKLVPARRR